MADDRRDLVWFVVVQLVFATALLHLALGVLNWARWLNAGFLVPQDWRWPAFVLSGIVVFLGLHLALQAENRRPYYLAGIAAMLGYVVGYFGWHLSGHRPLLLIGRGAGTEAISVQWLLDHLTAGPLEFVAVALEVLAALLLAWLYIVERRAQRADSP